LIGALPPPNAVLSVPDAHLHVYGKAPRAGRKVGHITVRADTDADLDEKVRKISSIELPDAPHP
jgi:5-(carboxyamino)imidazole ribonucleotide synthase